MGCVKACWVAGASCAVWLLACSPPRPSDEAGDSGVWQTAPDAGGGMDGGVNPDASRPGADAGLCIFPAAVRGFDWTVGTNGPTRYYAHAPASPVGLTIALHGTNGSAESLAENKVEWASFFRDAVMHGLALLVPESTQRTVPRQWDNDPSTTNPDITRVVALLNMMVQQGLVSSATPINVMGISQGGGVAGIFAEVMRSMGKPVRAVAVYCAGDSATYRSSRYNLPTTFCVAAEDDVAGDAEGVQANVDVLVGKGVDVELYVQPVRQACPERFTRVPGLSTADSVAIFNGLVGGGSLAADGTVLLTSSDMDTGGEGVPGLPAAYAAASDRVREQLRVVAAQHAFFGDRNQETLAFFTNHR